MPPIIVVEDGLPVVRKPGSSEDPKTEIPRRLESWVQYGKALERKERVFSDSKKAHGEYLEAFFRSGDVNASATNPPVTTTAPAGLGRTEVAFELVIFVTFLFIGGFLFSRRMTGNVNRNLGFTPIILIVILGILAFGGYWLLPK